MVRSWRRGLAAIGAALAGVLAVGGAARAETILFVGNSFTYGATSPVKPYKPGR
jgi:hypothetical protein